MRLSVDRASDRAFVVSGELDLSTAGVFESALAGVRVFDGPLVLDLSAVSFIDSSGVGSLIRLALSLHGAGLVLRDPSPLVQRILELRGLGSAGLWTIEPLGT